MQEKMRRAGEFIFGRVLKTEIKVPIFSAMMNSLIQTLKSTCRTQTHQIVAAVMTSDTLFLRKESAFLLFHAKRAGFYSANCSVFRQFRAFLSRAVKLH